MMDNSIIFESDSNEARAFYGNFGYAHYRPNSFSFISNIERCFQYYSNIQTQKVSKIAFRNKDGLPKHFIDVFRDKESETFSLFSDKFISSIVEGNLPRHSRCIFTHSKMSFKQLGSNSDWYPHQDNGYKSKDSIRDGFAIFICLEDMNENNGCLQVFSGSHKYGLLSHKRIVEDHSTGDNQFYISSIPNNIEPKSIIAKKGDIIIFSPNTIHQSLSSVSSSKRLSLIAEIECFNSLKLDDYGKIPFFASGKLNLLERVILYAKTFFSPNLYWRFIKKNKRLGLMIRKIKYRL
jgi:hypothetical protein